MSSNVPTPPGAGSANLPPDPSEKGDDDAAVALLTPPKEEATPKEEKKEVAPPPAPEKEIEKEEEVEVEEGTEEVPEEEEEETEEIRAVDAKAGVKELKEKYPNIFKENPWLRNTIYRADRLSAIFPSVEAAEMAAGKVEGYDYLSDELSRGNSLPLLVALSKEENGSQKIEALVDNFIPTLYKSSEALYKRALEPVLKNLVRMAFDLGEKENNNDLKNSAAQFAKMLWNKWDIPEAVKMGTPEQPKPDPEKIQLQSRIYNEFRGDVDGRARIGLRNEIKKVIEQADPDGLYPERVRAAMLKDIEDEIDNSLSQDEEHVRAMEVQWKNARREGLAAHWKPRIANAWLGRAKNLLPAIRDRLLSDVGRKVGNSPENKQPTKVVKKHIPSGSGGVPPSKTIPAGQLTVEQAKKAGMSDMDIIMRTAK